MRTYGFVGFGLIGGSIARALREKQPDCRIIVYNRHREVALQAVEDKIADIAATDMGEEFGDCDWIFLCAPVLKNSEHMGILKSFIKKDCILTDVGSVKTSIHVTAKELDLEDQFIGGHPMAGSERVGYAASKDTLLQNAYYILTPTDSVPADRVEELRDLVSSLGAIPLILSYEQHDRIVAGISHLPHVIAASLVNLVRDTDSEEGTMKLVAAGGFKDITRIASSSAEMWRQICLSNGENITEFLDAYIESLQSARSLIGSQDGDRIYELFDGARKYRDSFVGSASGPIQRTYDFTVDIADEPGALAAIATLLALAGISIKNIGILHNREYLGGDLRVEFHDEANKEKAEQILTNHGYTIHKRAE